MGIPKGATRHMENPTFDVEESSDGGLLIRFSVPGSNFGPVEIELSFPAVEELVESLEQARIFAGDVG